MDKIAEKIICRALSLFLGTNRGIIIQVDGQRYIVFIELTKDKVQLIKIVKETDFMEDFSNLKEGTLIKFNSIDPKKLN